MSNAPNSETNSIYGPVGGNTIATPPRASAVQATTLISAYSVDSAGALGTAFQAFLVEIANTLIALGQWKGSA